MHIATNGKLMVVELKNKIKTKIAAQRAINLHQDSDF